MMDMLMATAGLPSMQAIGKALAVTAVGMFIQIAVFVSAVFFAVTVANVRPFQRFGILTALAVFFLIYIVMQVLLYVATTYIPLTVVINTAGKIVVSFSTSMAAKGRRRDGNRHRGLCHRAFNCLRPVCGHQRIDENKNQS